LRELSSAAVLPRREATDLFRLPFQDFATRRCSLRVSKPGVEAAVHDRVPSRQTSGRNRTVAFRARAAELQQLHDLSRFTNGDVQSGADGSLVLF
jgi:hypothetical protein